MEKTISLLKKVTKHDLTPVRVPKQLYIFYNAEDIVKIGEKLIDSVYLLDNYIFLLSENKIKECFYAIEYLKRNPKIVISY